MSLEFVCPENSSFPIVHYKFLAKGLNSDELVEYRVQDLPEEYNERAIDFMLEYFLPDEPFQQACSQEVREGAAGRLGNFYKEVVKSRVSLVCFAEGSEEIVGLNLLRVESESTEAPVLEKVYLYVHWNH